MSFKREFNARTTTIRIPTKSKYKAKQRLTHDALYALLVGSNSLRNDYNLGDEEYLALSELQQKVDDVIWEAEKVLEKCKKENRP